MLSTSESKLELTVWPPLLWILALAFVSVGARNFELGLSLDAPLYATIARQIARSGNWFLLDSRVPDLTPFAEHPHLGFWMEALVFKIFPAADWSARILGHLFYVGFLWMLFSFVRRHSDLGVAVVTTLLLWIWYQFSNTFSTFYLDPGVLFFGTASLFLAVKALESDRLWVAGFAGAALALAALYKGMTVLGFFPSLALVVWLSPIASFRKGLAVGIFLLGAIPLLAIYVLAIQHSQMPDFLQLYWSRQFTHRFGPQWNWSRLFGWEYWRQLLNYTYAIPILALPTLLRKGEGLQVWLPASLAAAFICLFAPANLNGSQYVVMVMPWLAWLSAQTMARWLPFSPDFLMRISGVFCLVAVMLLQYLPVRTHGRGPSPANLAAQALSRTGQATQVLIDPPGSTMPFIVGSSWAWYSDLPVKYLANPGKPPPAFPGAIYASGTSDQNQIIALKKLGWCPYEVPHDSPLMVPCPKS